MEIRPIRDSCILYEEYNIEDMQRLMDMEIEKDLMHKKHTHSIIRTCPVCKGKHCNVIDLCSKCA